MTRGSGHPGSQPAATARRASTADRAKSRGGASDRTGRAGRSPTGLPPARGQAPTSNPGGEPLFASPPWPSDAPEPWERTAVNLTRLVELAREGKQPSDVPNRAWRRLKEQSPDEAAAIARDLPEFKRVFGRVAVHVPAAMTEEETG